MNGLWSPQQTSSPAAVSGGSIILLWFAIIGFPPGTLCADALSQGTTNQVQASGQINDLSWPIDKVLDPSLKWVKRAGSFRRGLEVVRPDLRHSMSIIFRYAVDLSGERFITTIPMGSTSTGVAANYNAILKDAGYGNDIPIPDKDVILSCETTPTELPSNTDLPGYSVEGYLKRAGANFRAILISRELNDTGVMSGILVIDVFVSNITPLEQILKKQP